MSFSAYLAPTLAGYLLGALPFGYLVARAHGVDIFKAGSGNPGATNVKRVLGARAGNTVFALDAVKGAVAAGWVGFLTAPDLPDWKLRSLAGLLAAILGHSFSCFTRFKGGKGVATAAGGLLVLVPAACLLGGLVWVMAFYTTRYVSLGSILAAVAVPAAGWLLGYPLPLNLVVTLIGAFVIFRHRDNLRRLRNGTENRFARKSSPPATGDRKPDAGG